MWCDRMPLFNSISKDLFSTAEATLKTAKLSNIPLEKPY